MKQHTWGTSTCVVIRYDDPAIAYIRKGDYVYRVYNLLDGGTPYQQER